MGIDIHALNFLIYSKKIKPFKNTITIGRQQINEHENVVTKLLKPNKNYDHKKFCEELLLEYFGAINVDSIDYSDYEGASFVHDMSLPIPNGKFEKYDTVIDGGSLEHVFDVIQAIKNCTNLCKIGGQIIHLQMANNFCGHGFWQFSPEFFFSLYSRNNGYDNTEVYIADVNKTKVWFKVKNLENKRMDLISNNSLYILVRTVLKENKIDKLSVNQSDYVSKWGQKGRQEVNKQKSHKWRRFIKDIPLLYDLLSPIYRTLLSFKKNPGLNNNNPSLSKIKISDLNE